MAAIAPHLHDVLANVSPRPSRLHLPEQKRALRDSDGRIALEVLRHLLGARPMTPERFPVTEQAFQAVARRPGYILGQKRCRRMIKRLWSTGLIGKAGQYRQPYRNSSVRSGFCVCLYKLGHSAVPDPMSTIMKKKYDIPAFARHLSAFTTELRGAVLQKSGTEYRYFYRFSNPLLQPYVVMDGLAKGLITDGMLREVQRIRRSEEVGIEEEPEDLDALQ